MIYTELNEHSFAYELSANKDNGFSYEGAKTLYNYLGDCEFEGRFDPVALRCQFSEMSSEEILSDYKHKLDSEDLVSYEDDEVLESLLEVLEQETIIIKISDNSYIIDTEF